MSLMELYGNLPGVKRRPSWMPPEYGTPGIVPAQAGTDLGLGEDQGAVDYYASQPRAPEKKGGGLGEVLKTLFAGALDGVAKHYGFEPGGYNMMKKRMEQEEERKNLLEKLALERAGYVWKKGIDQQFADPPELPADVRVAQWFQNAPPEQKAAYLESRRGDPLVSTTLPGNRFYSGPASGLPGALGAVAGGGNPDITPTIEDGHSYTPGPGGRANPANWKPVGGGVSNGPGNFRP